MPQVPLSKRKGPQDNGYIYRITNLTNGTKYVGQTYYDVLHRFKVHLGTYAASKDTAMGRAIIKYGRANFSIATIEVCPIFKLNDQEIFWIKELGTLSPNGYNLTAGGLNKSPSDETRLKLSAACKKVLHDVNWNRNVSRALLGTKHTEKTKKKLSAYHTGTSAPWKWRHVLAVNVESGEERFFINHRICAQDFNVTSSAIDNSIRRSGRFLKKWRLEHVG